MAGKKESIEGRGGTSSAAAVKSPGSGSATTGSSRKKGLAPFASLEDLSDDSPPDDKIRLTLPGIREDPAPSGAGQRPTITTPRIDISRASSSSHHDDSSPERELFAGGEGLGSGSTKIGLGFTEEMAQELRNSTEELDFQDPEEETKSRRKKLHHQQQAVGFIHVTKYELETQSEKEIRERKDSTCSEGGLLLIGGRTSRLSSIGSVASGGSVASHISIGSAISGHSHLSGTSYKSNQSRLSAASNVSRASRCSSPHRMLLETSFCGPKPIPTLSLEAEYPPSESVEATLLARKTDITGAVLPPEECLKPSKQFSSAMLPLELRSGSTKSNTLEVKTNKASRSHSERIAKISGPAVVVARSSSARSHTKRTTAKKKQDENALVRIIPLHGSLDDSDDTLAPDDQEDAQDLPVLGSSIGVPFTPDGGIFIPLKGPIDDPAIRELTSRTAQSIGPRKTKAAKTTSQPTTTSKESIRKPEIEESDLVRFISLHGDNDEEIRLERERKLETQRPSSRNSQNVLFSSSPHFSGQHVKPKKPRTPEPKSKCKPSTLDVKNGRPAQSMTNLPRDESRTPSPASTIARSLLFRRSSDSSGSSRKTANMSGSSDSKSKKDSKNKSMFTTLFKKTSKDTTPTKTQEKPAIDPKISNVEFKFKQEKEPDSIIIPLHSPDSVIKPCVFTEPDEITTDVPDYEKKLAKLSPQKPRAEDDDLFHSMKKVLENKNIIVVDVINSDSAVCYEAIIETPRASRTATRKGDRSPAAEKSPVAHDKSGISGDEIADEPIIIADKPAVILDKSLTTREKSMAGGKTSSSADKLIKSTAVIELENLESEPRVRKSSYCSTQSQSRSPSTHWQIDKPYEEPSLERQVIDELQRKLQERVQMVMNEQKSTPEPPIDAGTGETRQTVSREFADGTKKTTRTDTADETAQYTKGDETSTSSTLRKEMSTSSKISSLPPSREETEEKRSSESESMISHPESEVDPCAGAVAESSKPVDDCDEERKGLFHQTESMDDELPYVPTTLPQERSVALPIIPVSQRVSEVKTCPVDRPRSTTPIQPSNLDEYAASHDPNATSSKLSKTEKMQITLPRSDSTTTRRHSAGASANQKPKPWTQFAEEAINSPQKEGKNKEHSEASPPPLPPRGATSHTQPTTNWVNFEEAPEQRRVPKRITTLPLRQSTSTAQPPASPVVYSYVNPEECSCECHESSGSHKVANLQCYSKDSDPCTFKKTPRNENKRYRT